MMPNGLLDPVLISISVYLMQPFCALCYTLRYAWDAQWVLFVMASRLQNSLGGFLVSFFPSVPLLDEDLAFPISF